MGYCGSPHRCCSWHLPTSRFASEDGAHDWNDYFALSPGFLFTDIQPSTSVYQQQIPSSSYVPAGPHVPLNEIYSHPYRYVVRHTDHPTNVPSGSGIVRSRVAYPCVCPYPPNSCPTTHNPQFIYIQNQLRLWQQSQNNQQHQQHHDRQQDQQPQRRNHHHRSEHGQQHPRQQEQPLQDQQQPRVQEQQQPRVQEQQQPRAQEQQQPQLQEQQQPQLQEHQQHGQTTQVLSSSDRMRLQRAIRMLIQDLQRIMSVNQPVPAAENDVDNSQVENTENVEDIRDSVHVQGEETNGSHSVCPHDAEEE